MSAKFNVQSYPLPAAVAARVSAMSGNEAGVAAAGGGGGMVGAGAGVVGPTIAGPTMEIETRMRLEGRVRVLKVFNHRVDSGVKCGVVIEVSHGSVLGFHC